MHTPPQISTAIALRVATALASRVSSVAPMLVCNMCASDCRMRVTSSTALLTSVGQSCKVSGAPLARCGCLSIIGSPLVDRPMSRDRDAEQCCDYDRARAAAVDDRSEQKAQRACYQRGSDRMTLDDVVGTHLAFGLFNFFIDVGQGVAQVLAGVVALSLDR